MEFFQGPLGIVLGKQACFLPLGIQPARNDRASRASRGWQGTRTRWQRGCLMSIRLTSAIVIATNAAATDPVAVAAQTDTLIDHIHPHQANALGVT